MFKKMAILGALIGAMVVPSLASANSAGSCVVTDAQVTFSNFVPGGSYTRAWQANVNGVPANAGVEDFSPTVEGQAFTFHIPLGLSEPSTVQVLTGHVGGALSPAGPAFLCGPEKVVPATPVVTTPPVTSPPVTKPKPKPKKPPKVSKPRPKVKITCLDLKRVGAGRGWYKKLGIRYYECHVPVSRSMPVAPVAG